MRATSNIAIIIAVWALIVAAASGALAEPTVGARDGWTVIETPHGFKELSDKLDAAIKAEGMLKVTQASASAGARGAGITIPGNKVVGVYRNDFARRMLAASVAAGIEAPIRFYITEEADGAATLSYVTPTTVFAPYFDEGGAALEALAAELDVVFAAIAARATE